MQRTNIHTDNTVVELEVQRVPWNPPKHIPLFYLAQPISKRKAESMYVCNCKNNLPTSTAGVLKVVLFSYIASVARYSII